MLFDTSKLLREPEATYRANAKTHVTSHSLRDYARCPLLYRRKQLGLIPEQTSAAFTFGRAAHVMVLEGPQVFRHQYCVGGPINEKTGRPFGRDTKAFAEWEAKQGKPCISDDDYETLRCMYTSVSEHKHAVELLSAGVAEGVVRREMYGLPCQARIDWIHAVHGIVEFKTCDDLDFFIADARRFGYARQLAFYVCMLMPIPTDAHIIATEKREPFRTGVFQIPTGILGSAADDNFTAAYALRNSIATDTWPTRYENVVVAHDIL